MERGIRYWLGKVWRPALIVAFVAAPMLLVAGVVTFIRLDQAPPAASAVVPIILDGQGSERRAVDLPRGTYHVSWQAQGGNRFVASLSGAQVMTLVNEEPPSPRSGETFAALDGGRYVVDVQSRSRWSIVFAREREAPPA